MKNMCYRLETTGLMQETVSKQFLVIKELWRAKKLQLCGSDWIESQSRVERLIKESLK